MARLSSLNFRLTANIAPFKKGLNKAERAMDKMGRKMQTVGKNLSMKLTAPLTALGAVSFNVFRGFEAQMSKVKAVSGATAEEFDALSENAKELGASTMFSAREVAELQTEFAKLGFTASEITKVTESTLALAQASGSDLATAATVAGSTLRAFGLDASETQRVTDVMAASFSSSALDMGLFADSMKFVAPVAKSAGMSLEETSAMLAVLANNGIKGSQAGTALRRIISEIGATGKPTTEAIKELAAQGLNLADAKDEVGRSAQSALLVLAEGADQIEPTTRALERAEGAAGRMAAVMGDNAEGAMKRLQSATEGLAISMGEVIAEAVVPMVEGIASLASKLNKTSPAFKKFAVITGAVLAAAGPLVFMTGGLIRNVRLLGGVMKNTAAATRLAEAAQKALTIAQKMNPIGLLLVGLSALAAAYFGLSKNQEDVIDNHDKISDAANEEISNTRVRAQQAKNLIEALKDETLAEGDRVRIVNRLNTEYQDLLPNLISEKDGVEKLTTAQDNLNDAVLKKIKLIGIEDKLAQKFQKAAEVDDLLSQSRKRLTDIQNKYTESTGQVLTIQEALRISTTDFANPLRDVAQEFVDAASDVDLYSSQLNGLNNEITGLTRQQISLGPAVQSTNDQLEEGAESTEDYSEGVVTLTPKVATLGTSINKTGAELKNVNVEMDKGITLQDKMILTGMRLSEALTDIANRMAVDVAVGVGEMLGSIAAGRAGMADLGKFGLEMMADLMHSVGQAAIEIGVALLGIQLSLKSFNPFLAIAAGVALIGFASFVRGRLDAASDKASGIPAMANGGIVTGPTLALIGEGKESEAVIPLSKLSTMINAGGSSPVTVTGRISGADILLSNERAQRTRQRQRGF